MKEKLKAFLEKLEQKDTYDKYGGHPRDPEVMRSMLDDSPLAEDEYYYEKGESSEDNIPREIHAERKRQMQERKMADWRAWDKEEKLREQNRPSFKNLMKKMGLYKEKEFRHRSE
jgi:hypothetical protein